MHRNYKKLLRINIKLSCVCSCRFVLSVIFSARFCLGSATSFCHFFSFLHVCGYNGTLNFKFLILLSPTLCIEFSLYLKFILLIQKCTSVLFFLGPTVSLKPIFSFKKIFKFSSPSARNDFNSLYFFQW